MAVKKTNKEVDVKKEVVVEETPVETNAVEEVADAVNVDTTVHVEPQAIKNAKEQKGNVRIRMSKDHHCFIGGVHYDLKKDTCYNVPSNVKDVLNRAGLLAPL